VLIAVPNIAGPDKVTGCTPGRTSASALSSVNGGSHAGRTTAATVWMRGADAVDRGSNVVLQERPEPPLTTTEKDLSPRRWLALGVLLAAGFMDLLDTTIVNVAIPSIRAGTDASYAAIQWVVAGYLLSVAVGLITFGRLGDIIGRRRVFLIGVVGFGATSLCCGLAPAPAVLVGGRILQGMFAAAMIPQILSTIQVSFPRDEQPRALALYSTMAGVAVMSGPLLAGVLLSVLDLSWRSIFLINVPVSVLLVVATVTIVPESKGREVERLDLGGAALISAALFALVFGLIQGRELAWPIWLIGLLLSSPVLFALFALYERRRERCHESPLVPLALFSQPAFSAGLLVVIVFFSGVVGFFLALSLFLQLGLGYSPMQSALTTFPSSLGLIIASIVSTRRAPRPSRQILALGSLLMAVSLAGLVLVVNHFGGEVVAWDIRPVMFMFGIGMGLTLPSLADVIIGGVAERDAGAASGLINTGLQVGNAVGVAIIGVILFSVLGSHAEDSAKLASPQISRQLTTLGVPAKTRAVTEQGFRACFVDSARQQDPAATPASCRGQASQSDEESTKMTGQVLAAAGDWARKDNFAAAIQRAMAYGVAVFTSSFVLLLLSPRQRYPARHRKPRGSWVLWGR